MKNCGSLIATALTSEDVADLDADRRDEERLPVVEVEARGVASKDPDEVDVVVAVDIACIVNHVGGHQFVVV